MQDIKVGPIGNSYYYRIGDRLSAHKYANAASAWHEARLPQHVVRDRLEPRAAKQMHIVHVKGYGI